MHKSLKLYESGDCWMCNSYINKFRILFLHDEEKKMVEDYMKVNKKHFNQAINELVKEGVQKKCKKY